MDSVVGGGIVARHAGGTYVDLGEFMLGRPWSRIDVPDQGRFRMRVEVEANYGAPYTPSGSLQPNE